MLVEIVLCAIATMGSAVPSAHETVVAQYASTSELVEGDSCAHNALSLVDFAEPGEFSFERTLSVALVWLGCLKRAVGATVRDQSCENQDHLLPPPKLRRCISALSRDDAVRMYQLAVQVVDHFEMVSTPRFQAVLKGQVDGLVDGARRSSILQESILAYSEGLVLRMHRIEKAHVEALEIATENARTANDSIDFSNELRQQLMAFSDEYNTWASLLQGMVANAGKVAEQLQERMARLEARTADQYRSLQVAYSCFRSVSKLRLRYAGVLYMCYTTATTVSSSFPAAGPIASLVRAMKWTVPLALVVIGARDRNSCWTVVDPLTWADLLPSYVGGRLGLVSTVGLCIVLFGTLRNVKKSKRAELEVQYPDRVVWHDVESQCSYSRPQK